MKRAGFSLIEVLVAMTLIAMHTRKPKHSVMGIKILRLILPP